MKGNVNKMLWDNLFKNPAERILKWLIANGIFLFILTIFLIFLAVKYRDKVNKVLSIWVVTNEVKENLDSIRCDVKELKVDMNIMNDDIDILKNNFDSLNRKKIATQEDIQKIYAFNRVQWNTFLDFRDKVPDNEVMKKILDVLQSKKKMNFEYEYEIGVEKAMDTCEINDYLEKITELE